MNVSICSRKQAEALLKNGFPAHTAVISFFDPPTRRFRQTEPPPDFCGKAERVFQIALHDIDLSILGEYGLGNAIRVQRVFGGVPAATAAPPAFAVHKVRL